MNLLLLFYFTLITLIDESDISEPGQPESSSIVGECISLLSLRDVFSVCCISLVWIYFIVVKFWFVAT